MQDAEKWVLEWHQESNNLHIQKLSDLLSRNRDAYMRDKPRPNWITLYVGTNSECSAAAESIRPTIRKRDKERAQVTA